MTADSSWCGAALNVRLQIIGEIAVGENLATGRQLRGTTEQSNRDTTDKNWLELQLCLAQRRVGATALYSGFWFPFLVLLTSWYFIII